MSSGNEGWRSKVGLPKTPTQWKAAAESRYFEAPSQDDERHLRQRNVNFDKLHAGESVSSVHPRDLSGWQSASKIQRSHFMTTKILGGLQKAQPCSRAPKKPMTSQRSTYTGDHIRHETLNSGSEASSEYKPSSTQEITDTMDTDSDQGHVTLSTGSYHGSGSGSQGSMSRSQGDLTGSEPSLSRAFTQGSAHSVADDELYPAFKGEETVNVAAIALLRTLTMGCPEAKLEWEANRKGFVHQLGEAWIRAYTDGCLSSEKREDVHAILEVKPFALTKRANQTLMQMGMEMLAYILYCELNGKPKKRCFMEACFRHQFFHVLADFDQVNYLNFLQGLESEFDHSFLALKLVGPFDLFIRNDVYKLGRMSLTLTIEMSMDEQTRVETAAIEDAERQEQGEE